MFLWIDLFAGKPHPARAALRVAHVNDRQLQRASNLLRGKTNAVRFGPKPAFWAAMGLFTLWYAYITYLSYSALLPRPLAFLCVLYPIHLTLFSRTLAAGLSFENVRRYRTGYRLIYAVAGVAIVATRFWKSA